jgi:hypothetical protein
LVLRQRLLACKRARVASAQAKPVAVDRIDSSQRECAGILFKWGTEGREALSDKPLPGEDAKVDESLACAAVDREPGKTKQEKEELI